MTRLESTSVEELRAALDSTEEAKPAQRLLAAIAHKNGVTQTELAEWHGVERKTIYRWFRRLETEPVERAVRDEPRPGRPGKLTEDQRSTLEATLREPPESAGYEEAATWTPALVREHLRGAYGVEYSVPSCRRLLRESGLRYREMRAGEADRRGLDPEEAGTRRWLVGREDE